MAKQKQTVYVCTNCGEQTAKWFGRCPSCDQWNTMKEEDYSPPAAVEKAKKINTAERFQNAYRHVYIWLGFKRRR